MAWTLFTNAQPSTDVVTKQHRDAATLEREFVRVYEENAAFVWRSVRRLGVASHAVEDAAQEVFLVVHRRLAEFEGRSSFRTWLFGIVLNVVRRHRRSSKREALRVELPDGVLDDASETHLDAAERREAMRVLHVFLESLDDARREVFVMSELEQMTAVEVAEATGENLRTVYSRLRVVREAFEELVARHRARERWRGP